MHHYLLDSTITTNLSKCFKLPLTYKTIDVFFKCGLNLSDAAKELYIHRNTLIYRLDKIQRYISYDIRDFNNAILVKILFFIWTEKNNFYLKMFSE